MNTLLLTIATIISSVFGVHAPVQQLVSTPDYVTKSELQTAMDAYVARVQSPKLGAAPSPAALATYTLAGSGVSSSATSITLTSLTIKQTSQKITTSDLRQGASDLFYITIEPGNTTRQEIVGCSTVTQNSNGTATLGGCSRGMSPIYPYTASSTLRFTHAGSSQVIFGDAPQIFNDFNNYVSSAIVSGAVDSSATVKGIVEKATNAEAAGHAAVGSGNTTAPLALTTDIASSTRTANTAQVIVASSTNGYLDETYLNPTMRNNYTFSGTTALATTTMIGLAPMVMASTSVSSGQTSMTLSILPRDRFKLYIMASTTGNANLTVTFNGDSSALYYPRFYLTGQTSLNPSGYLGSSGNIYLEFDILNRTDTYKMMTINGLTMCISGAVCASPADSVGTSTSAVYKSTARISSVTITASAAALGAGGFMNAVYPIY